MSRRGWTRRAAALACAATLVVPGLTGCGLPDERRTQVVDDASVPYDLLGPGEVPRADQTEEPAAPVGVPVVFWSRADDLLVPAAVDVACRQSPTQVVRQVLATLAATPDADEREAGLASALPSTARLTLVRVEGGVAEVDLDVVIGDAERLPTAVGQVVLSVTSAPGVDAVRIVTSGEPVELPLPGGARVTGAATAEEYASLLPPRLAPEVTGSGDIGCPAPPV